MTTTRERHQKALDNYLASSAWWRQNNHPKTPEPIRKLIDCFLDWQENEISDMQRALDRQREGS